MRTKLILAQPEAALDRLLEALANELTDVSDEEILAAAQELGMNPLMKGSAAFLGLRIAPFADLSEWAEFFESEQLGTSLATLSLKGSGVTSPFEPKTKGRRARRPPAVERKQ